MLYWLTAEAFAQSTETSSATVITTIVSVISGIVSISSLVFTVWRFSSDKSEKKIEAVEHQANTAALSLNGTMVTLQAFERRLQEVERSLSAQERVGAHLAGANHTNRIAELEQASKTHDVHLATVKTELRSVVDIAHKTSSLVQDLNRLLLEGS
jgi:hypothetical protein